MISHTPRSRIRLLFAVALVASAAGVGLAVFRAPGPGEVSGDIVSGLTRTNPHDAPDPESPAAGSLESLLPGLEAKVAADPKNTDARLLLAQTYGELDRRADALRVLGKLVTERPGDGQIRFLHAELLMRGESRADLRAAFDGFAASIRTYPEAERFARLHQGEIRLRLGDKPGAVRLWRDYARRLPADDPHRALFEHALAQAQQERDG